MEMITINTDMLMSEIPSVDDISLELGYIGKIIEKREYEIILSHVKKLDVKSKLQDKFHLTDKDFNFFFEIINLSNDELCFRVKRIQ